jgi:hypothetical protein
MTKDEVIAVMGQPNSVAAQGKNEDLNYSVKDDSGGGYFQIDRPYYVRLVDGRVESYGMYNQITPIRTMMPPPNNSAMLRIGMTKEEALATMGKPISVSAEGDVELLNYSLPEYNGISTNSDRPPLRHPVDQRTRWMRLATPPRVWGPVAHDRPRVTPPRGVMR